VGLGEVILVEKLKIELIGLRLPEVRPGDDVVDLILKAVSDEGTSLHDGDVIVVASKILSKALGLLVDIKTVKPSKKAYRIARRAGSDPRFVELLLRESDGIILALPFKKLATELLGLESLSKDPSKAAKALELYSTVFITMRDGMLWSESGMDTSNHPPGIYSIPPRRLDELARRISDEVFKRTGMRVSVVISDTELFPWGAMDVARGSYGIEPMRREFGELDSYGKPKFGAVDNLAFLVCSAASLLMGQRAEGVPVVVVRGLKYDWSEKGVNEVLSTGFSPRKMSLALKETIKHSVRVFGLRWLFKLLLRFLKISTHPRA
jgi:coenzyme F420-0:L-glutamate ligase/coenzyme F420-1:gamma-L-glutamate ligase